VVIQTTSHKGKQMKRTVMLVAVMALGLAACGGSDGGSSGLSDAQAQAASSAIEEAKAGGLELDEACVNGVAAKLSDDDAAKLAASDDGGSPDLSAEGEALGLELLGCANSDDLVDLFVAGMTESGQAIDEDCAREKLADYDVSELVAASQGGDAPADLISAMLECVDAGG